MDCYRDYSKFEINHNCHEKCTCGKCGDDCGKCDKCKCEDDPCKCLLKGDKGDRGDKGERGEQGIQGIQGIQGERGDQGMQGEQGMQGMQGVQGIQGERGDKGEQGERGIQGEKGDTGAQGLKGDRGDKGEQGEQGVKGKKGDKGDKGEKGEKGDRGDQGLQGLKGETGAQGAKGDTGDKGEKGDRGDQGLQGLKGETGAQGAKGDTGDKGEKGDRGDQGIQGLQGLKGDTGAQGVQGATGATGAQGPQGFTGATGPQGPVGPKGDPGCCCCQPGPVGATGATGATGAQGIQGEQGKVGGSVCPCEITMGKVSDFLIANAFDFTATLNASYDITLESTDELPATFFGTWALEFGEEEIVPLCKIESLNLSFTTLQEKDTFISLLSPILAQTLSCCHNCATCDDCAELLTVDKYRNIIDMPSTCNYEYNLDADCNCPDCDVYAKRFSLCNFVNTTGEKLRGSIENKKDLGKGITVISTLKDEFLANDILKTIELTGLSSVVLSYEEEGEFKVTIACLEDVRYIKFDDIDEII